MKKKKEDKTYPIIISTFFHIIYLINSLKYLIIIKIVLKSLLRARHITNILGLKIALSINHPVQAVVDVES